MRFRIYVAQLQSTVAYSLHVFTLHHLPGVCLFRSESISKVKRVNSESCLSSVETCVFCSREFVCTLLVYSKYLTAPWMYTSNNSKSSLPTHCTPNAHMYTHIDVNVQYSHTYYAFSIQTQRYVRVYDLSKLELKKKLFSGVKWISSIDIHPQGTGLLIGTRSVQSLCIGTHSVQCYCIGTHLQVTVLLYRHPPTGYSATV